ncbi:FRAT-87 protein [Ileibacterium valens]|uniref:FRAT-87 protein n=1 Tax=Ileibacterium valens TaxID=1862668 RepID=UPI00272CA98D|nr:FRAT-87 protein [Ileibacterium valens]
MTKEEFRKALEKAVGGTVYGEEIIKDLIGHFDETGKYAQDAKDRLDDRIGILNGWIKKHEAEGATAKVAEEKANLEIAKLALAAVE